MPDEKRGPGRPKKVRVDVMERADQQSLDVLLSDPRYKARLANPFGEPSAPIAMKDATRECRWVNGAIQNDHIWRKKSGGWDGVTPDQLVDTDQIGGFNVSPEGYIVRGERGQELLMSMPKVVIKAIQLAKTAENNRAGKPQNVRAGAIEAYGRTDPDAADAVSHQRVDIRDSYERIQVTPEE